VALLLGGFFIAFAAFVVASHSPSAGTSKLNPVSDKLLLAPYLSASEQAHVANAIQSLDEQCMASHGLKYLPSANSTGEYEVLGDASNPLYIDAKELRRLGYGVYLGDTLDMNGTSPFSSIVNPNNPEEAYVLSLSRVKQESYSTAFGGNQPQLVRLADGKTFYTSPGGCQGLAYGKVYGTVGKDWGILHYTKVFTLAQDVADGVAYQVANSQQYLRAMSRWSSCMTTHGAMFSSRNSEFSYLVREYQLQPRNRATNLRREMRLAKLDAACTNAASLNSVSETETVKAVEYLSKEQLKALLQWRSMQLHAALVTKAILK